MNPVNNSLFTRFTTKSIVDSDFTGPPPSRKVRRYQEEFQVYGGSGVSVQKFWVEEEALTPEEHMLRVFFEGFDRIFSMKTAIRAFKNNLKNHAVSESWVSLLIKSIAEQRNEHRSKCEEIFKEISSVLNEFFPTFLPKPIAMRLAILFIEYGALQKKPIYFKAALILQGYAIGLYNGYQVPNVKKLTDYSQNSEVNRNIAIGFEAVVAEDLRSGRWRQYISHFNQFELISFSKALRYLYESTKAPLFIIAAFEAVSAYPKNPLEDLREIQIELNKIQGKKGEGKALFRCGERNGVFVQSMIDQLKKLREGEIAGLEESLKAVFTKLEFFVNSNHQRKCRHEYYYAHPKHRPEGSLFKLLNYYRGFISVEEFGITRENAIECLEQIKLFDLSIAVGNCGSLNLQYSRSSIELRREILKLRPDLPTWEVLMNTLNRQKMRDASAWLEPHNWISEQTALKAKALVIQFVNSQALSHRLQASSPRGVIIAMRGNSGAGKSTYIKKMAGDLLKGVLTPDRIKAVLKQSKLLNCQVHEEGASFFRHRLFREFALKQKMNFILDMRLTSLKNIVSDVLEPAKAKGSEVRIADFDVSLITSLYRVLARPPFGEDPCPVLKGIVEGFFEIRQERMKIIERVLQEDCVSEYQLYFGSRQKLIAEKSGKELKVLDNQAFQAAIEEPAAIEEILSQVITEATIQDAIQRGDIPEVKAASLQKWKGVTLKDAVIRHALGE